MQQVDPGLARLLVRARRNDDQTAVGQILIIARVDRAGLREGNAVADVSRLALGLGPVGVQQDKLGKQAARRQCVSYGRAHKAGTDDRAFLQIHHDLPPATFIFLIFR